MPFQEAEDKERQDSADAARTRFKEHVSWQIKKVVRGQDVLHDESM